MPYGFVRSTDTWGVNSLPWQQARDAGLNGLVFDVNDPHLDQALVNARSQGFKAGIWIPEGQEGGDPKAYADKLVQLAQKYGPDILVPNLENAVAGGKGSSGYAWNDAVAQALKGRLGNTPLAVATLPNKDDFNYGAWTNLGAQIWAEAFGANTATDQFDPAQIRQRLLANGVPGDLAYTIGAPGQGGDAPIGGEFTIDDLNPQQWSVLKQAVHSAGLLPLARPSSTPTSAPTSAGAQAASPLEALRRSIIAARSGG